MIKPATLFNTLMLVPLLGATESLASALGLWLMFVIVINLFGLGIAPLRLQLAPAAQLPASVLLAAALTSCAELIAQAWALQWQQHVGFYGALIALLCVALEHSGHFHSTRLERLRQYSLFGALMAGLGLLRELIGSGTLGNSFSLLAGAAQTQKPGWVLFADGGLHLATLTPGGFILLGLLIAAWQAWRPSPSH
jgi:electron transport complex protein RnfE